MLGYRQSRAISEVLAHYRAQRLSRRAALRRLAGLGFSTATAAVLLGARPGGALTALAQSGGTPEAPIQAANTPVAAATPPLGEQPDGSYVWHVRVGGVDMEAMIEAMAFFPEEITINAGDRVFFEFLSFHTVTFPGNQDPPPLFVPESAVLGTPAAAATPATGGERYAVNPAAGFPSGPPVHDGESYVNSGLPDPTVPPFVVEFTAPGTFDYLCLVHPVVMKARVIVQEQGAQRPHDQAAYDQQAAEQLEAVLAQGQTLIEQHSQTGQATPAAGGTVWEVVAGVGEENAQVLRFLPERLEISAGDTVRWTNLGGTEPHTVTFLGDGEPPELILLEPQSGDPPLLVLNPEVTAEAGGPSYDGMSYANSGWLQENAAEFPEGVTFPQTWELTFDTPGEYPYYCVLHGAAEEGELMGMVGSIVVS